MTEQEFHLQLTLAEGHAHLQDFPAALRVVRALPQEWQERSEIVLLRMTMLICLEMWEEAETWGNKAVETMPHAAGIWYSLAVAQAHLHKTSDAKSHFAKSGG